MRDLLNQLRFHARRLTLAVDMPDGPAKRVQIASACTAIEWLAGCIRIRSKGN
jgi:hypothetical protein